MPQDVDKLLEWCDSARKILNNPSPFKGKARNLMETRAKAVQIQLAALKTLIDDEQNQTKRQELNLKYDAFYDELKGAATRARDAAEKWRNPPKSIKKKKEREAYKKEQRAIVKTSSHQLDELASKIGLFVANELNTDTVEFEEAIRNRHAIDKRAYDIDLPKAEKLARELESLNWGNHKWEEPLTTKVAAAKDLTNQTDEADRDYINALGLIRQALALHTTQLRAVEVARESDRKKARHRPVYLDKKRRVEEGIKYLKTLPGSEKQQQILKNFIVEAEKKANVDDFESAYDELSGLSGTIAKGEQASVSFLADVGSENFRTKRDEALEALSNYETLAKFQDPEGIQTEKEKIEECLMTVYADPSLADAEAIKLQAITLRLTAKLEPTENSPQWFVNKYKEIHSEVNTAIAQVREIATAATFESLLDEYRQAEVMFASQFYEVAYSLLSVIKTDCELVTQTATRHKTVWDQGIKDHLASVEEAKENVVNAYVPLQTAAKEVIILYDASLDLVSQHDYEKANEKFAALRLMIETGPYFTAKSDLATLKAKLDEGKIAFDNAVKDADEQAEELREKGVDVSQYSDEIATKKLEVGSALWNTKTLEELTAWTTTELPKITEITNRIAGVISNPGLLDSAKEDTLKSSIRKKLKMCLQESHPDGLDPLQNRVDGMDTLGTLEELESLESDLQGWLDGLTDEISSIRERTTTLLTSLRKKLDKLQKSHRKHRKLVESLRDKLLDCEGMIKSTLLEVVQTGETQLAEVKIEIENVAEDDFNAVKKKIKELIKKIKNDDLTECMPSKKKVFAYRLKNEIPDAAREHAPEKALAADGPVGVIEKEITDAILDASDRASKRRELKTKAGQLRELLIAPLTDSPSLVESLEAQLKAAEAPGEAGEDAAALDLTRIEKTIRDATDKPAIRLALEQTTRQQELATTLAEADWEAAKDVFEKNAERDAAAKHKSVSKQERSEDFYKGIAAVKKQAIDLAKAGNYTDAKLKLRQAESLAKQFIENPMGAKATARGNLEKVSRSWNEAVAKYVIEVRNLDQAIASAINEENPLDDALKTAAQNASMCLQRLMLVFDASKFDHSVRVLNNSTETKIVRRSKEDGLRFVRRYQTQLKKDPVISRIGVNPFDVEVPITLMRAKLGDLETNLLRS